MDVLVEDASVQGDSAPRSIANGVYHLDRHEDVDLVITGRGGGSDTDLTAFNTKVVADAAFTASTPSVIADGHTDDRFVADERLQTRQRMPSPVRGEPGNHSVALAGASEHHRTVPGQPFYPAATHPPAWSRRPSVTT